MYGSPNYTTNILNPERVATVVQTKKKESTGLISFFRILVVVFEVGLSLLIPATAGFAGLGAQVGIGLIGAGANTALSAASDSLSGVGIGIDFASAFIPALSEFRTATKITKATTSETAARLTSQRLNLVASSEGKAISKQAKLSELLEKKGASSYDKAIAKAKKDAARLVADVKESKDIDAIMEIRALEEESGGFYRQAAIERAKILGKYNTSEERIAAKVKEWEDVFEKIKNIPKAKKLTRSTFLKEVEKLSGKEKAEVVKGIYTQALRSKGSAQFARLSVTAKKQISDTMELLSDEGKTILQSVMAKIANKGLSRSQILKEVDEALKIIIELHPEDAVHILKLNQADFARAFQVFGKNADPNVANRLVKQAGSRDFNDRVVQNFQLIDPNDLGRAPVERAYQYLKKKINERIERSAWEGAARATKKGLKKAAKLDEAFLNSGGKYWPSNRYLLGYKKLHEIGPDNFMVLIKFNKLYTSSGSGKNKNGKQDIVINCTKHDLKMFASEGKDYWFRVGKRRGWFFSRGGKRHGLSVGTVTNELSLFLGFVPIPALRNVLSIVSNWVENISDMAQGNYFKQYWPKLERSFMRSLVNRSARLATRVVTGGLYKKAKTVAAAGKASEAALANGLKASSKEYQALVRTAMNTAGRKAAWVGREFQRVATITLSTFEGKTSDGLFTFTSGATSSGSGIKNLAKRIALSGAPTSFKGALIRKGNRGGQIKGRELVGARRNFSQIGRIWGAVTPSGVGIKPIRSMTGFKI